MRRRTPVKCFLTLCLTAWLVAGAAGAEPPEPKPVPLTKEQQDKLKERDRLLQETNRLLDNKQVEEGMALAEMALALTRQVRGERHAEALILGQSLAEAYERQANFPAAKKHRQEVLAALRQVHGPDHWRVTDARIALEDVERLARLEPADRRRLAEAQQLHGEVDQLYRQGRAPEAVPLAQKALDITKQLLGQRHPDYAQSLNNLAQLYRSQGEYAKAEPLYRQALALRKQVLGQRHPSYAASLNNLALLYQAQGEYGRAEPLFRQARDIAEQVLGRRHPLYAVSLNNLAELYRVQGEYAKAEPLLRQALEIKKQVLGERHPDYATSLRSLALLYLEQREYARAEPPCRQALEITKQALGERHPDYAQSLNNLAGLYLEQGDYARAEPLFRQAQDVVKQALGERHPLYAFTLNNLAVLYQDQGEYAKAELLFNQAMAALRQDPKGPRRDIGQLNAADLRPLPVTVTALGNFGRLLEQRLGAKPTAAELRAADGACSLALAVRERLRQEVLRHDASKLHHGARELDLAPRRIGLCQRLFDWEGRVADLETALATAEQGSARVFLEQLGKARAQVVGHVSAELRAQEAALRGQLRELDTRLAREQDKPVDRRDPDKVGQLLDEQKKVEDRLIELIRRMEQEYPQYAALKYPKPCSLAQARACLAPSEVALLFVPGRRRSYLILVEAQPTRGDKANGLAVYPLLGRDDLADGVSRLTDRDAFDSLRKARAAGAQAYELLLAPVKDRIKDKDLVVVAGGPLAYVPFEALVEDGHFLIEKHRIRYAPSLTALHLVRLWEQTRDKPQRPLWAMADSVYDKADKRVAGTPDLDQATKDALAKYLARADRGPAAGETYARLRFTGQEAEAIRARLGAADGDVLTGLQATEAAVKAASEKGLLARARYFHFATHGILGLDTGQPPALVLSLVGNDGAYDAEGGVNDGFLRLDEVTRLKLNADLVVLSACETGRGRLYAGEGVTGLARAFLYAGSRGVVCSLWAVDDRETATFMADLYGGLKEGKVGADALRAAKLAMIRAGKPPVYWAPFILIGE
jgi:CHAT domain-containing protein/Tfp pilus assembly protein PilF